MASSVTWLNLLPAIIGAWASKSSGFHNIPICFGSLDVAGESRVKCGSKAVVFELTNGSYMQPSLSSLVTRPFPDVFEPVPIVKP